MALSKETQERLYKESGGSTEADLVAALRRVFPHGHEDYLPQCVAEMELHSQKNHDYAAGGDSLGNFKRVAAILEQYPGLKLSDPKVVALVYALKQVDAVLWGLAQNITHKVEGILPRLDDVAIYAKIVKCLTIEMARNKSIDEFGADIRGESLNGTAKACGWSEDQMKKEAESYTSVPAGRTIETESEYQRNRKRMGFDEQAKCPEFNTTQSRTNHTTTNWQR